MGEVAGGVADLAVGHHDAGFRPAFDGVDDVGGAQRNIEVGNIVLVKKRGVVRGDAYAEDADVIIFEDEMVVGLFGDGDGAGGLGIQSERKHKQTSDKASKSEERFLSPRADLPPGRKGRKCVGLLRSK